MRCCWYGELGCLIGWNKGRVVMEFRCELGCLLFGWGIRLGEGGIGKIGVLVLSTNYIWFANSLQKSLQNTLGMDYWKHYCHSSIDFFGKSKPYYPIFSCVLETFWNIRKLDFLKSNFAIRPRGNNLEFSTKQLFSC